MGLGPKCPSENQHSHTRLHGFPFDLVSSSFQLSRIISQVRDLHSNPYLRQMRDSTDKGSEARMCKLHAGNGRQNWGYASFEDF